MLLFVLSFVLPLLSSLLLLMFAVVVGCAYCIVVVVVVILCCCFRYCYRRCRVVVYCCDTAFVAIAVAVVG